MSDMDQPLSLEEQQAERAWAAWASGSAATGTADRGWHDAMAAAMAAIGARSGPAPAHLQQRLQQAASAECARRQPRQAASMQPDDGRPVGFVRGMLLGAAAGVLASVLVLNGPSPDPIAERQALVAAGIQPIAWQPGPSTAHGTVAGDVVWDGDTQRGFLRIEGLSSLDASRAYQLWIVDGERPGSAPVDGGVFRLAGPREQVVEIQARLPIGSAKAFVVTVEEASGVVVSAQEDVVAIAGG